jgi:short-subunit dehydrogenase
MAVKTILITGASSGIGAALARHYAAPGVTLVLWGREAERLGETAAACRARGAAADTALFDLTCFGELVATLDAADSRHPIDLAIFNAGLGGIVPRDRVAQDVTTAERMIGVNFTAPVIGANLIAERMAARGRGRIVLIGSVAGAFPLPLAPTYSATKAGLALFADALGIRLARHGVGVSLVAPGFIDTPMSQDLNQPRPFLITAEAAAAAIAAKIGRGRPRIVVPWQFAVITALAGLMPDAILRRVLARF